MTTLTAEKIRLVMLAIRALRLTGRIGVDEPVSPERMARYSAELGVPVSEKTFRNAERHSLAVARLALEARLMRDAQTRNPKREIRNEENSI